MPWLSILMALFSFFAARKGKSSNNARAAIAATAAGLGTYYVTHDTDWGKENLGQFDGVDALKATTQITATDADGNATVNGTTSVRTTTDSSGTKVVIPNSPVAPGASNTTGLLADAVKKFTPSATTAVIGGATVASILNRKWVPFAIGGIILLLLLR